MKRPKRSQGDFKAVQGVVSIASAGWGDEEGSSLPFGTVRGRVPIGFVEFFGQW